MSNDSNDKAAQAREGMFDNIAGKAKEVAGAVTGKDGLVEEGQLQQEEARKRRRPCRPYPALRWPRPARCRAVQP